MGETEVLNLMRGFAIALGVVLMGLSARAYVVRKRAEDSGGASPLFLPSWSMIAWILAVAALIHDVYARFDEELSLTTPLATMAFIMGILSLMRILEVSEQ